MIICIMFTKTSSSVPFRSLFRGSCMQFLISSIIVFFVIFLVVKTSASGKPHQLHRKPQHPSKESIPSPAAALRAILCLQEYVLLLHIYTGE